MKYILPYNITSNSAKLLAQGIGALRIKGNKWLKGGDVVINWGNSSIYPKSKRPIRLLNNPDAVALASNKVETFITLSEHGILTVPWTIDKDYARQWLNNGEVVIGRSIIHGSQGRGIHIITADDVNFPSCALYTRFLSRCHEYRVHVINGEVIDFSKKRRRSDAVVNEYIRNHNNGWVFCREQATLPDKVKLSAIKSINALGLDFGALDVLYKGMDDKAYVLEVNTAPGLEGTTLTKYTETFRRLL